MENVEQDVKTVVKKSRKTHIENTNEHRKRKLKYKESTRNSYYTRILKKSQYEQQICKLVKLKEGHTVCIPYRHLKRKKHQLTKN